MLKYDEIWSNNVEENLIKLYKSDELLDTDSILADKLERLALLYYANAKKGNILIIVEKINAISSIVLSPSYFGDRHYSVNLKNNVVSIMEDLQSLSKAIRISVKDIMKERKTEEEENLSYRSQRFENINTNRSNELYDKIN